MRLLLVHLRTERGALLGWGIGLFLYLAMIGAFYAAVADAEGWDEVWQNLPEGMRETFGGVADITSVHGYYVSQAGSYLPILVGMFLVAAGTKRLAGAEESGLLDHLLARPVSRRQHFVALAGALAVAAGLVLAALLAGTLLGFVLGGARGLDLLRLAGAVGDLVPAALFFLGLGLLLGAAWHRRGPAFGTAVALVLGLFVVDVLANLADWASWLGYLNPYGYYARSDLFHGRLDVWYWTLVPLVGAAMAVLGGWLFDRKDLHA